jgi:uncharacterized protein (DUF1501 family)
MKRRDFLKSMGAMAGYTAIPGFLGRIDEASASNLSLDHQSRFVLFRIDGAMDSTLGLDPYLAPTQAIDEQDLYLGYDAEKSPMVNIRGTQISLGPSARSMAPFAEKMAIVRGIYVGPNDLGHPFAFQHMSSGRTQEAAPHGVAYLGSRYAPSRVATNSPIMRGQLKPFGILLTSVLKTQMVNLAASPSNSILSLYSEKRLGVNQYLDLLKERGNLSKFIEVMSHRRIEMDQQEYDNSIASGKSTAEAEASARLKGVKDEHVALAALYAGIARVVQIDISRDEGGNTLDTHANHARTHHSVQKARWDRIATFLELLQELGLSEHTLVMVITEFNRTPGLNANGGKDHNYTDNAIALIGRGVQGGSVVGGHTLYKRADGFPYAFWAGRFLDFESGELVPVDKEKWKREGHDAAMALNVDLIRPADVWISVLNSLDPSFVRDLPKDARLLPGIFNRP